MSLSSHIREGTIRVSTWDSTAPKVSTLHWIVGSNWANGPRFVAASASGALRSALCRVLLTLCSVRIDVDELLSEIAEQEQQIEAERDLIGVIHRKRGSKGRKALDDDEQTSRKRMRRALVDCNADRASVAESNIPAIETSIPGSGTKQGRSKMSTSLKLKPTTVAAVLWYPCLFCPSLEVADLLEVFDPSEDVKARSKSRNEIVAAHLSCVNSIPEVWVENRSAGDLTVLVVMGANNIPKDRWNLVSLRRKEVA